MLTSWRQATVIGKGLKIVGNIEADGSVKIKGQIEGGSIARNFRFRIPGGSQEPSRLTELSWMEWYRDR